jgi:hypothetical protein
MAFEELPAVFSSCANRQLIAQWLKRLMRGAMFDVICFGAGLWVASKFLHWIVRNGWYTIELPAHDGELHYDTSRTPRCN